MATTPIFDLREGWSPLAAGNRLVTVVPNQRTNTWRTNHTQLIMMRLTVTPTMVRVSSFTHTHFCWVLHTFPAFLSDITVSARCNGDALQDHIPQLAQTSRLLLYLKVRITNLYILVENCRIWIWRTIKKIRGMRVGVKRKDITQAAAICPPAVGLESYSISSPRLNISKFVYQYCICQNHSKFVTFQIPPTREIKNSLAWIRHEAKRLRPKQSKDSCNLCAGKSHGSCSDFKMLQTCLDLYTLLRQRWSSDISRYWHSIKLDLALMCGTLRLSSFHNITAWLFRSYRFLGKWQLKDLQKKNQVAEWSGCKWPRNFALPCGGRKQKSMFQN